MSLSSKKNLSELNDDQLVQLCCQGEKTAFQTLVARYQKKLFSIAYGMLRNAEDSLDIIQEAFLKVHRHIGNFQGNSSFYTWIYRIVVNLCIDFIRRENKHQALDYDDSIQHATENSPNDSLPLSNHSIDPIQALNNKELGQQIWKAVEKLSPSHRAVITLREIEGMSYEEIAQTLECSKGTVMSRLHHARAKLREALEQYVITGDSKQKNAHETTSSDFIKTIEATHKK